MASADESQLLHDALCEATRRLAGTLEDARFEPRSSYTVVSFPTFPLPSFNGVWVDGDTPLVELAEGLEELKDAEAPLGFLVRRRATQGVEGAVRELGFTSADRIPGMIVTADALQEAPSPDLEVLRIETADGFAQSLAVAADGFGVPAELLAPIYMLEVTSMDGFNVYLGRADGKDVTTALGFVLGDAVGIFNVATPPEHRAHGYGAAITAHAVRDGFESGGTFAFLQSTPMGEPVYRRLGFREVETYTLFTRPNSH